MNQRDDALRDFDKIVGEFMRQLVREQLAKCTDPQIELFNRMYKNIDAIKPEQMRHAYRQCRVGLRKQGRGIMARGGKCDCTPDHTGFGWCGDCVKAHREQIWKRLSKEERNYDRQFDPSGSMTLDAATDIEANDDREYNTSCSCHINPPCSYCTDGPDNDEYTGSR